MNENLYSILKVNIQISRQQTLHEARWFSVGLADLNHWPKSRFKSNDFFKHKIIRFKSQRSALCWLFCMQGINQKDVQSYKIFNNTSV